MQTQQIVLNSEKFRAVSNASHTAEVVITALSQRERLRHFTDITRLRNALIRAGEKIVDSDYVSFWTGMQDSGAGVIVYGRKGKPDKFEWHYSMKKVAQAALEGKDIPAERVTALPLKSRTLPAKKQAKVVRLSQSKRPVSVKPATPQASRFIYIPLRKDFNLEFSVPSNLSKEEAQVIARALERFSA